MEMILAFPLDPKAFHSPSPFCFFPVAISKGCQYWKLWLNRYSCAPHNYSKTVFMLVSSNLQHSGFWHSQRERAGRLWGSVYNMKPLIKWLRSWKHFAIRDIQRASLQNESIYRVVHQFHTDLASLGARRIHVGQLSSASCCVPHWFLLLILATVQLCLMFCWSRRSINHNQHVAPPFEHAQLIP